MNSRRFPTGTLLLATALLCVSCGNDSEEAGTYLESYLKFLADNPKQYSQFNEEVVARHFFKDRRDGFYLDVGCAHPRESSTTYYLEEHLGWRGIGIDALKHYGKPWKKLRPESKFLSYAVTDNTGDTITFYQAGPISSIDEDWAPKHFGIEGKPIKVHTITLNDVLKRQGVTKIDFLSMDIEGAEPAALAGFDIKKYGVELICIEAHGSKKMENNILKYFEENGYEHIEELKPYDIANWYFRLKK